MYAGTTHNSVFSNLSSTLYLSEGLSDLPTNYSLYQNYPYPINPSTKIQFRISNFKFVSLKVYDVLGNEVATLVNEELSPGEYEVEFNSSRLVSGIYFYQLRIGGPETSLPAGQAGSGQGIIQTKKMILLK